MSQAKAYRGAQTLVVVLENRAVAELANQRELAELRTVYDPLTPPDDQKPGAAGHAGIEGLDRSKGLSRQEHRERLEDLAGLARLPEPTAIL